jgi:hypothetical protein
MKEADGYINEKKGLVKIENQGRSNRKGIGEMLFDSKTEGMWRTSF